MTVYPPLAPGDIHVFALRTDHRAVRERLPDYEGMLSSEEQQRAERFRQRALRERYVLSHAMLRKVLGAYLRAIPGEIRILTEDRGRPYLAEHSGIDFNLSHTGGMSVVAISSAVVGIDIERLRDDIDAKAVAQSVFSRAEVVTLRRGVAASKTPFFDYWTIKEAYAKAVGLGIHIDFRKIDVSLDEPLVVALQHPAGGGDDWAFALYGNDQYRFAIATQRQGNEDPMIRLFEMNNELQPSGTLAMKLLNTSCRTGLSKEHIFGNHGPGRL